MDSVDIPIDPLILEEWLLHLHEKTDSQERIIEESEQIFLSFIDLHENFVKLVFSIVDEFALDSNVKYLAIHLYNKYMNYRSWEAYKVSDKSENVKASWEQEQEKINSDAKLCLLSCIQLASKMNSNINFLDISDVKTVLRRIDPGREYSKWRVLQSEFHVFKAVEFEMPQCTPKDCVDVLLAITGLRNMPNILETAEHLLDLSYLYHEELYNSLKMMVEHKVPKSCFDERSLMIMASNALFLGAAITICSVFCVSVKGTDLMQAELMKRVASLVGIKDEDIWDMANLLFSISVQKLS